MVAATDIFTYCQTTNLAKQFAIRTNSLSGFLDLAATIGVAYFKEYREPSGDNNPLFDAIGGVTSADYNCAASMNYVGQTIKYTFVYEVADTNFVDQLQQNLVDELFQWVASARWRKSSRKIAKTFTNKIHNTYLMQSDFKII